MIACYDLGRCPPTYDAVAFLALAELERLRSDDDHLDVVVLPGPRAGFRRDSLWPYTTEERIQLRDKVLVPLCRLLPSVRSVEVVDDRSALGWGKFEYHVGLPAILRALKAGCRPLRADKLLPRPAHPPVVTFTLREAEHHPLRNSRTDEWLLAAYDLVSRGYLVTIVRDARTVGAGLGSVSSAWGDADAPADLVVRAQLYASADLNVGISNGPMWMSIFMDAPTCMLRPTTNAAGACYDDVFFARHGIRRGDQLPASPPHQRLVWEEDTRENIVRAVEEALADVQPA